MATAKALAYEKVWCEKPSYDKAERLYFEKIAKVLSNKIIQNCSLTTNNVHQKQEDVNTNLSLKFENCDDNKLQLVDNASNEVLKQSKCQLKNDKSTKKEEECNELKTENVNIEEKCDVIDIKMKESNTFNDAAKKCNAKEVKEKKNKADTRHRNKGKGKNGIKEQKPVLLDQGNQQSSCPIVPTSGRLAYEVAKAREYIKQSLQCMDALTALTGVPNSGQDVGSRMAVLEKDNQDLRNVVQELRNIIDKLEKRVKALEEEKTCSVKPVAKLEQQSDSCSLASASCAKLEKEPAKEDDDEDVDLFGSDSEGEDAEAAKIREERLAAYAAKKSKKPALIAKSNIILDVKPWDDETDMKAMEAEVRKIETDGLLWGAAKLVPLAFGIHKLQISCVVEDDKVSVDWLTEKIQEIEDYVQSVDIAAFNKV